MLFRSISAERRVNSNSTRTTPSAESQLLRQQAAQIKELQRQLAELKRTAAEQAEVSAAEEVTELTEEVEEVVPTQPAKVRPAAALPAQRNGTAVPRVNRPLAKESTEVQKSGNPLSGLLGGLGAKLR